MMQRRTPASTLTSAAATMASSRSSSQRSSLQRFQFRRTTVQRSSVCSTVSCVSVDGDQPSSLAGQHPWTTFENHIKAIKVNEVQFETKMIGRLPSAAFQKVLHEFKANETPTENKHDLDTSLIEDPDDGPAAADNDLTTGARNILQLLAKGNNYVGGSRESDSLARGDLYVNGQHPRQLDELTKGRKVGITKVLEDIRPSESVRNRTRCKTGGTKWNIDCGFREDAGVPVQLDRKWKELTVDEKIRRQLYERYIERPNSWLEGFVTDSGKRIVEELVKEGGLEGDVVNGRGRGKRRSRKEHTTRKIE